MQTAGDLKPIAQQQPPAELDSDDPDVANSDLHTPPYNASNQRGNRRLVERISGWRLNAFFVSVAINVGLCFAAAIFPLVPSSQWLEFLIAIAVGSHISFILLVSGFRYSIAVKLALGSCFGVVCLWVISNLETLGPLNFLGFRGYFFALILGQTFFLTHAAAWLSKWCDLRVEKWYSISDLLVLFTTFAILFPLVLPILPFDIDAGMEALTPGSHWKRVAVPLASSVLGHVLVINVWCFLVVNLFLQPRSRRKHRFSKSEEVLARLNGWPVLFAIVCGVCLYFVSRQVSPATARFSLYSAAWMFMSISPVCGMKS